MVIIKDKDNKKRKLDNHLSINKEKSEKKRLSIDTNNKQENEEPTDIESGNKNRSRKYNNESTTAPPLLKSPFNFNKIPIINNETYEKDTQNDIQNDIQNENDYIDRLNKVTTNQLPQNNIPNQIYNILSKKEFMKFCESIYDQQEYSHKLSIQLEGSIKKSTHLLQALQSSGQMIEGLVRSNFRDLQIEYGEKFGKALTNLNNRLEIIESKLSIDNKEKGKEKEAVKETETETETITEDENKNKNKNHKTKTKK